jgi:WD40 repeat protein
VRQNHPSCVRGWIYISLAVTNRWSECIQTLEGHTDWIATLAFSPDGKLVMSRDNMATRIWNVDKRATTRSRNVGDGIERLSPSSTSKQSVLDHRKTRRMAEKWTMTSSQTSSAIDECFDWVRWKSENILWLPPDYRSRCSAVCNDTVVLSHSSGKLTFLTFNTARLQQLGAV